MLDFVRDDGAVACVGLSPPDGKGAAVDFCGKDVAGAVRGLWKQQRLSVLHLFIYNYQF